MSYKEALHDVIFNFSHEVVESKIFTDNPNYNKWFLECEGRKENLRRKLTSHEQKVMFDELTNSYFNLYNIDFSYMAVQGAIFNIKHSNISEENKIDIFDISGLKKFHNSEKYSTLTNNVKSIKQIFEKLLDNKIREEYRVFNSEYNKGYIYWIKQSFIYAGGVISEMTLY